MDSKAYKHFISYRRDGGNSYARTVFQQLQLDGIEKDMIFFDQYSVDGYFEKEIMNAIDGCDDFIIILTNTTLNRCKNPNDMVRKEIAQAIKGGKNIIPVAVYGIRSEFKSFPKDLPDDISSLGKLDCLPLHMDKTFVSCIQLIEEKFGRILKSAGPENNDEKDRTLSEIEIDVAKDATRIADSYYYGENQCLQDAKFYYLVGAKLGNAYAQYSYGYILCHDLPVSERDYKEAFEWFIKAADNGDNSSLLELGILCFYGKGVDQSFEAANEWYEKGDAKGVPQCSYYLGMNYLNGKGKEPNPQKALVLFEKAQKSDVIDKDKVARQIELAKVMIKN